MSENSRYRGLVEAAQLPQLPQTLQWEAFYDAQKALESFSVVAPIVRYCAIAQPSAEIQRYA